MFQDKTSKLSVLLRKAIEFRQSKPMIGQNARHRLTVALSDSTIVALSIQLVRAMEIVPSAMHIRLVKRTAPFRFSTRTYLRRRK